MSHALIIDDNMAIGRAIQDRLISLGFDSFDRTWNEAQAVRAAQSHSPDLVIVGETIMCDSPIQTGRHIVAQFDAPVILVDSGMCKVQGRRPKNANLDGLFSLSDNGAAVTAACAPKAIEAEVSSGSGRVLPLQAVAAARTV